MNFMASLISEQLREQQMGIAGAITQPMWQKAAAFAGEVHAPEIHFHDLPFPEVPASVAQATRVALTVAGLYHVEDPHVQASALLHNVLELTGVTFDDLSGQFGHLVALRVQRLTREPTVDEELHLLRLQTCDWQTRVIKLADAADLMLDEEVPLEERIERATRVLPLAHGDEYSIQRAHRHLAGLLEEAAVEAAMMVPFTPRVARPQEVYAGAGPSFAG